MLLFLSIHLCSAHPDFLFLSTCHLSFLFILSIGVHFALDEENSVENDTGASSNHLIKFFNAQVALEVRYSKQYSTRFCGGSSGTIGLTEAPPGVRHKVQAWLEVRILLSANRSNGICVGSVHQTLCGNFVFLQHDKPLLCVSMLLIRSDNIVIFHEINKVCSMVLEPLKLLICLDILDYMTATTLLSNYICSTLYQCRNRHATLIVTQDFSMYHCIVVSCIFPKLQQTFLYCFTWRKVESVTSCV